MSMSLMMGQGPFGHAPAGRFTIEFVRDGLMYVEPLPRRIRARIGGATVLDSTRAKLLHEHARLARYYVPRADVRWDLVGECAEDPPAGAPDLEDYVAFAWEAMDAWFEEDDEIIGHAIDPYHRVDVRASSREVRVSLGDTVLAQSTRGQALFETGLPTRWYLPSEDVVASLEPSELTSTCAYKGHANYLSLPGNAADENIAWFYTAPLHDAAAVKDHVAFFNERVDIAIDGEPQQRPRTPWSRPDWWQGTSEVR
ncbi:MAG: hypothetical protein QOG15_1309 [Solirubrobacteraceae bacterium]|nr:hypothetical protein [Solirubrobacteraceae bacterium]